MNNDIMASVSQTVSHYEKNFIAGCECDVARVVATDVAAAA